MSVSQSHIENLGSGEDGYELGGKAGVKEGGREGGRTLKAYLFLWYIHHYYSYLVYSMYILSRSIPVCTIIKNIIE